MSAKEDVAAEVRAHLARREMSARRAARELGWSDFYIGRRLHGSVAFDVDDLAALGKLLDLPITAFFDRPVVHARSGNLRIMTALRAAA